MNGSATRVACARCGSSRPGSIGRIQGGVAAVGPQPRRLIVTELRDGPDPVGASTSGELCSMTAAITVHQHTPSSSASWLTGRAFSPTWRHISVPARRVSTARTDTWSTVSVQVFASQSTSPQRHRRLFHTSRAGRPRHARSRMATGMRSWDSAREPHAPHPRPRRSSRCRSPAPRRSRPPPAPESRAVPAAPPPDHYRRSSSGVSSFLVAVEPPRRSWDPDPCGASSLPHAPQFNAKRQFSAMFSASPAPVAQWIELPPPKR